MSAVVVAFDGLIADTLPIRAQAIVDAAERENIVIHFDRALEIVPGRSLFECVTALLDPKHEEMADLLAIGAQQLISRRLASGVAIASNANAWIAQQRARGVRVVLRADSMRRDVERVLQLTELEYAFTFIRCMDDLPRAARQSSLESAYAAISIRLDGLRISTGRTAIEVADTVATVARNVLGSAKTSSVLD